MNEYCSDWDYFSNDSKIFLFVVLIDVEDNPHNFYFHNQHRIHRPKSPYISDGTALWINSQMDSLQSWKAGFQTLFLKVSLLVPNFSIFIFVFFSGASSSARKVAPLRTYMREFGEQYKEKQPESNSSSNIRFTTNLFAIDAQFKLVQAYSLLSTLKMSTLKKCVTPPTVKSDDEKLLAVWCSDFLINQEMNDDFHQYFFLREEAKREIDFLDEFLYKPSPPVALIGGTPGSGKSLTMFTWAWLKSCTVN